MSKDRTSNLKIGGVPSKQAMSLKALGYSARMLDILAEIAKNPKAQDSARVSAAGKILDKALPNQQETKLDGQLSTLNINRDYVSPRGWSVPTSTASLEGSNTVQGSGLAQES